MRRLDDRRLRRLEARRPRPQAPTPDRDPHVRAAFQCWAAGLSESMDDAHVALVFAWVDDLNGCQHEVCPVPRGLKAHLDIMRGWMCAGETRRVFALPPAVVEAYVTGDPELYPNEDCEECGLLLPSVVTIARPTEYLFPDCPRCGGWVHSQAWAVKHHAPGYELLIYPDSYKAIVRKRRHGYYDVTPDRQR